MARRARAGTPGARRHAGAPAESILNVIFEIYAVFTCFLTYYKPSRIKSRNCAPRACWHAGAPTESFLNVIFEIYAIFTCFLTYYTPSAKKVG